MLLFADGFDHYGTGSGGRLNMLRGAWAELSYTDATGQGYYPVSGISRTGSNSLRGVGPGLIARVPIRKSINVVGVAFGFYVEFLPVNLGNSRFDIRSSSNSVLVSIYLNTDGSLVVYKGDGSTILGITDSIITPATFHHIEYKVGLDNIAGSFALRVNGVEVMNLDNLDLGTTPTTQIAFRMNGVGAPNHYIDDLLIWDDEGDVNNDFMGPQKLLTRFCAGDTAKADWDITGSATGYGAINEVPPDNDTSYLNADFADLESEFTLPELPSEIASIGGVFIPAYARSDEAGLSTIRVSMVSDSEVSEGEDHNLAPQYTYYRDVYEIDPATGQPWTKSGFENALVNIKRVS